MEDTFLISTPFKSVKVHPVVLFTILNHYNRRPKDAEDVMGGTLLSFDSWRRNDSGFHQPMVCWKSRTAMLSITRSTKTVSWGVDGSGLLVDGGWNQVQREHVSPSFPTQNKSEVVPGGWVF